MLVLPLRFPGLNFHCLVLSVLFPDAAGGMVSLSLPLEFTQEHILSRGAVALLFKEHTGEKIMSFSSLSCLPPLGQRTA